MRQSANKKVHPPPTRREKKTEKHFPRQEMMSAMIMKAAGADVSAFPIAFLPSNCCSDDNNILLLQHKEPPINDFISLPQGYFQEKKKETFLFLEFKALRL